MNILFHSMKPKFFHCTAPEIKATYLSSFFVTVTRSLDLKTKLEQRLQMFSTCPQAKSAYDKECCFVILANKYACKYK